MGTSHCLERGSNVELSCFVRRRKKVEPGEKVHSTKQEQMDHMMGNRCVIEGSFEITCSLPTNKLRILVQRQLAQVSPDWDPPQVRLNCFHLFTVFPLIHHLNPPTVGGSRNSWLLHQGFQMQLNLILKKDIQHV